MAKKRVLSGMQPSGLLHLGNLMGALDNWRKLQDQYECYYFIADWHALTTNYADTSKQRTYVREMVIDWLAAGLDPEKCVIFQQSLVPDHAVLHVLLSMSTPLPWLERVPTYKEKMEQVADKDLHTYGFLGYPVLQAADILIYRANFVPVGVDQLPHLELTREICRRFNGLYGEVFPEPQPLMTEYPKLPGTDGRKMSKSYNNTLNLSDSPETITKKVMQMITDPARIRRQDPGNPDVCPLFALDRIFAPKEWCDYVNVECRRAGIGCVDDKKELLKHLLAYLKPIQDRRKELSAHPEKVTEIMQGGSRKARAIAAETMALVKEAMKL
jgi:tryptophanyl-tRNA synthetase